MKKFGFTLAEVLITLGIIGVVAALTAPQLVINSKSEAVGAKVSTAVSTLENAFQAAMLDDGVDKVNETKIFSTNLNYIGKYMNTTEIDNTNHYIITKSGIRIEINNSDVTKGGNYKPYISGAISNIVRKVDIITDSKSIKDGRNHFRFYLDERGLLYPMGGKDIYAYDNSKKLWNDSCNDSATTPSLNCTGRLVEKGYKMDY